MNAFTGFDENPVCFFNELNKEKSPIEIFPKVVIIRLPILISNLSTSQLTLA